MADDRHALAPDVSAVRFEISRFTDVDDLQRLWLELEERAVASFYLSWDWVGCWIREAGLAPTVLVGRAADTVVLLGVVTPATRRNVLPIGLHGLHLNMTGDDSTDIITTEYNGFLVARGYEGPLEPRAVSFLLSGVVVGGRRRDELHLKNIAPDFVPAVVAGGCMIRQVQHKPSWYVDLAAIRSTGCQYLDSLSSNTRQQIRRSIRLYEKRGPLTAEPARNLIEAMSFLDGLKCLHQSYWNSRGQPGGFAFAFFDRFQRRLVETCHAHGTIELFKISAGSWTIGYLYNFVHRGHVYAYQSGFNYEADGRMKPGLVSHSLCIRRHLDIGSDIYDFLAGEHRYKSNLGQPGPDMIYLIAERRTLSLRLESALYRLKKRLAALR